ncbi:MAG: SCO family protein [Deltaproteobacteria bacterium]|nr:SCO family protein [Deltaproteobacteria bacterium]
MPDTYPRLDRPAPPLGLVDQHGARVDVAALRGHPTLITFAFAHCETVCPALVSQALAAQRNAAPDSHPRVAIITLDPWRDTPSRLPALARSWQLPDDAIVLSGAPAEVNAALDRWNAPAIATNPPAKSTTPRSSTSSTPTPTSPSRQTATSASSAHSSPASDRTSAATAP